MTYKLQSHAGGLINMVREAQTIASAKQVTVEFEFNDIIFLVNSEVDEYSLFQNYQDALVMGWHKIGPIYHRWYDVDTNLELYTRRLYKVTKEKYLIQSREQVKQVEDFTAWWQLNFAKMDSMLKGYTKLLCTVTDVINDDPIYPMVISVIAGASIRTFSLTYDLYRNGNWIYFLPFNCDRYTLKFSCAGYKDIYLRDLKLKEGRTNKIKVQMQLED